MDALLESELNPDPVEQFAQWFERAAAAGLPEPNAMTLATATPDGFPSARMVLLKGHDQRGFVFFSNYLSRKGEELQRNPCAALVFFWPELRRQIRIEGYVERVSADESDAYFNSRARGSQIAAAVSRQSAVLPDRETLDRAVAALAAECVDREIPRPETWGGYRVIPTAIEFWQGRPNRLHDRLRYGRMDDGTWLIERLSP
jgi:pyridoxamine 5'-phosphate oxidase